MKENMEMAEIRSINIEDFKAKKQLLDYMDDDFVLINSLDYNIDSNDSIRLECMLIAVCVEGRIQLDINLKTYQLQEGDVLFGLPGMLVSHIMMSPHYAVKLIGFSTRFLQRIFKMGSDTWKAAIHINKNPLFKKGSGGTSSRLFELYRELVMIKLSSNSHAYNREVVRYLFSALLCEMMGQMKNMIADTHDSASPSKENIKLENHILRKFLVLLSEDNGMHRSVSYFASALCYTPKYLSQVIKQTCGKSPLELINESVMEHIKYRLRRSDKSIKEIAEEFNFPNQSFFGKYVKAHLGMTPAKYRNSLLEGGI